MQQEHTITLIEGAFSPDDAREILMRLISDKIRFHELKNFSSMERFGQYDASAQKRLPELSASMKSLEEVLEQAKQEKVQLRVSSQITIHFEPRPQG